MQTPLRAAGWGYSSKVLYAYQGGPQPLFFKSIVEAVAGEGYLSGRRA